MTRLLARFSGITFVLVALSSVDAGAETSPKMQDFYCKEAPVGRPFVYQTVLQSCGDGKPLLRQNICAVPSSCAYIGGDTRRQIDEISKKYLSKSFDQLTGEEKSALVNKVLPPTAWLMSSLTCQKTSEGAICPEPEKCKEDIHYNPVVADLDLSTFNRLKEKTQIEPSAPGTVKAFPMRSDDAPQSGNLENR